MRNGGCCGIIIMSDGAISFMIGRGIVLNYSIESRSSHMLIRHQGLKCQTVAQKFYS